jgi:3,4-dihydroxy 2-butanone 4-phosphate synthase/GTP cyclohydrolase II
MKKNNSLSNVERAISDIKKGKMVIIVDDKHRENEGDLAMAAEKVTPHAINFMARYGRGLICVPMLSERLDELEIPDMVSDNTSRFGTGFTVSVDARKGTTTGISAYDRAVTIKTLINKNTKPEDLVRPGHVFPLRAKEGGVLQRAGQTEASIDLAKLSGLYPAAVICEIMKENGKMARMNYLKKFAKKYGLTIVSVADIIKYRLQKERLVRRVVETTLPTMFGDWKLILYESDIDKYHHIALIKGEIDHEKPVLVRMHSQCLTGDTFYSLRCDCGEQLRTSMKIIHEHGNGVIVYMRQEGRGIGLVNKLHAYALQDKGYDTVEANKKLGFPPDLRDYGIGAQILLDIGVRKILLLTNNPKKIVGLEGYGLEVIKRIPIEIEPNKNNIKYLKTKKKKLGHLLKNV